MENQNIQIVRDCIAQIQNGKNFSRLSDYYSETCIFKSPPYVGLGIIPDDSSGERIVIKRVAPDGPAAGKVQAGDVLLRARDEKGDWEGYEQLRTGLWGQGKLGTELTLTLLRNGETVEETIVRGRVQGFNGTIAEFKDSWQHFLETEMPDLHTEINLILASGDLVAYYATNTGTNTLYGQSAIWPECNILRLENGKIVEWWGVEDTLTEWRQLGFRITEPVKEPA
jgi:predicted ester cyclase